MANIFFIKPFLTALQEGRSVRFGIFLLIWIIAIAVLVAGIVNWVDFWNQVSGQNASGVIGVILYQIVFLVLLYFLLQILVIRASDVLNVEAFDKEFTVIPVTSVLIRMAGELFAAICIFQGIGLLIFAWFASAPARYTGLGSFENLYGLFVLVYGTGFKVGILALVNGIILGFASIVVAYFFAEWTIMILKLYLDLKQVRKISEGYAKPAASGTGTPSPRTDQQ